MNNDGAVSPLDALLIINDLNAKAARSLTVADATPPFIDVNGDGFVAPIDVLQVINAIETAIPEGEATEFHQSAQTVAAVASLEAEGESLPPFAPNVESRLVDRSSRSDASTPKGAAPSRLPFYAVNSISAPADPLRHSRRVDLAVIGDLFEATALEAVLDELSGDIATRWDASQVIG